MQGRLERDYLMLSGIQHVVFCRRQWALIHIEKQWSENLRTAEGHILHKNADNPKFSQKRKGLITSMAMPIVSHRLGLYGVADAVEFVQGESSAYSTAIPRRRGFWQVFPVEYKRGKPKEIECDKVQLCAQAICLEEMFSVEITEGAIFYGETKHRMNVEFCATLREQTFIAAELMHSIFETGQTPVPVVQKGCRMCSLKDLCMPYCVAEARSVAEYMKMESLL